MGILDRVKAQIEVWRIEKYTKRRDVTTPDFERKGIAYLSIVQFHRAPD